MELKSYITFFISDQNINTGREMHDIKRALNNYMNYKAPKESISSHGLPPSKVFMSTAEAFGSGQQHSAQGLRTHGGLDLDTEEFNKQKRKPDIPPLQLTNPT